MTMTAGKVGIVTNDLENQAFVLCIFYKCLIFFLSMGVLQ